MQAALEMITIVSKHNDRWRDAAENCLVRKTSERVIGIRAGDLHHVLYGPFPICEINDRSSIRLTIVHPRPTLALRANTSDGN